MAGLAVDIASEVEELAGGSLVSRSRQEGEGAGGLSNSSRAEW